MFTRATRLRFAGGGQTPALSAAYDELRAAAGTVAGERDADTVTEVLWAGLHGLTTLSRNRRLRPDYDTERIELLVAQMSLCPASEATASL
jgi:hypothetical protein